MQTCRFPIIIAASNVLSTRTRTVPIVAADHTRTSSRRATRVARRDASGPAPHGPFAKNSHGPPYIKPPQLPVLSSSQHTQKKSKQARAKPLPVPTLSHTHRRQPKAGKPAAMARAAVFLAVLLLAAVAVAPLAAEAREVVADAAEGRSLASDAPSDAPAPSPDSASPSDAPSSSSDA